MEQMNKSEESLWESLANLPLYIWRVFLCSLWYHQAKSALLPSLILLRWHKFHGGHVGSGHLTCSTFQSSVNRLPDSLTAQHDPNDPCLQILSKIWMISFVGTLMLQKLFTLDCQSDASAKKTVPELSCTGTNTVTALSSITQPTLPGFTRFTRYNLY